MITAAQSVIFQILFLLFSFDLKLSGKNIHLSQTEFSYLGMIPLLTLSFSRRVLVYQDNSVNEKIKLFRRTSTPSSLIFHKSIYLFIYPSNYFNFFNSRFWTPVQILYGWRWLGWVQKNWTRDNLSIKTGSLRQSESRHFCWKHDLHFLSQELRLWKGMPRQKLRSN